MQSQSTRLRYVLETEHDIKRENVILSVEFIDNPIYINAPNLQNQKT